MPERTLEREASDLLTMVQLARRVFDALNALEAPPALPVEAQRSLRLFYDLSEYHGIAPPDAPHIDPGGI